MESNRYAVAVFGFNEDIQTFLELLKVMCRYDVLREERNDGSFMGILSTADKITFNDFSNLCLSLNDKIQLGFCTCEDPAV